MVKETKKAFQNSCPTLWHTCEMNFRSITNCIYVQIGVCFSLGNQFRNIFSAGADFPNYYS